MLIINVLIIISSKRFEKLYKLFGQTRGWLVKYKLSDFFVCISCTYYLSQRPLRSAY